MCSGNTVRSLQRAWLDLEVLESVQVWTLQVWTVCVQETSVGGQWHVCAKHRKVCLQNTRKCVCKHKKVWAPYKQGQTERSIHTAKQLFATVCRAVHVCSLCKCTKLNWFYFHSIRCESVWACWSTCARNFFCARNVFEKVASLCHHCLAHRSISDSANKNSGRITFQQQHILLQCCSGGHSINV